MIRDRCRDENPFLPDMGYSLRRYFVDEFHIKEISEIPRNSLVLDLGGNKLNKRGLFDIEHYGLRVIYSNLSPSKSPDVQADAGETPFKSRLFDVVICSELLEHVYSPADVINEVYRILAPGGIVLICIPFMNNIHGDPFDFGRYTDFFLRRLLESAGFSDILIEKQGLFWCVITDMLRGLVYSKAAKWKNAAAIKFTSHLLYLAKRKAILWDGRSGRDRFLSSFTTGFGIRAIKND